MQLAKQGGRPDLLCSMTPEPPSAEPVGYPRAEWYYDDIAQGPDEQENEYKYVYIFVMVQMFIKHIWILSPQY